MEIMPEQYENINDSSPVQRGNARLQNLQVLNAILFVAEPRCRWHGLLPRFDNWNSVYMRINRWTKNGVLDRVLARLQTEQIVRIKIEAFTLDSTPMKVHPNGRGTEKEIAYKPSENLAEAGHRDSYGCRRCSNDSNPRALTGQCSGQALLQQLDPIPGKVAVLIDKACEGNETRQLVLDLGMIPLGPPKSKCLGPRECDRER